MPLIKYFGSINDVILLTGYSRSKSLGGYFILRGHPNLNCWPMGRFVVPIGCIGVVSSGLFMGRSISPIGRDSKTLMWPFIGVTI